MQSPERDRDPAFEEHLVDRDVAPVGFPNKIYAVGGAGKQMAIQVFGQDWFLAEASRPDGVSDTVDVHILDTATEREEQERRTAGSLTTRAEAIASELRLHDPAGTVREVTVDLLYLTKNIYNNQVADFIGTETIEHIRENTAVDQWWLTEAHLTDPNSPGNMFNFAKGVIRRRALGKALFYKALAEDASRMRDVFDLGGSDGPPEIAIFAGLGGGTGSGQAIDIAQHLRRHNEDARITLFATLPTTREGSNERANAFAALSELEYLALPDTRAENPFNDIVLFPLNPTGHRGGETTTKDLIEFDEAFGYAFISYYNNPDVDHPFEGANEFAPFTVAMPQVLRYSVQELHQAREIGHDLLEYKRQALAAERSIYTAIVEFLREHYDDQAPGEPDALNQTDIDKLVYHLRDLESLITSPIFEHLEYDAVTIGREMLAGIYGDHEIDETDIRTVIEDEGIGAIIDAIEFELEGQSHEPGRLQEFEDIDDEALRRVIVEDLHQFQSLFDLLCERKRVPAEQDAIDRLLETFLDPDADRTVIRERWGKLNALLDDTRETVVDLEDERRDVELDIEAAKTEYDEEVSTAYQEWYAAVEDDLQTLRSLGDVNLKGDLNHLQSKLDTLAAEIQRKPPEEVAVDVAEPVNAIQEEVAEIDELDRRFAEERDDITESAQAVRQARDQWHTIKEQEAGGGSILPFRGSNTADEERDQYRALQAKLEQAGVFRISNLPADLSSDSFRLEVRYNPADDGRLLDHVQSQRTRTKARVLEVFTDEVRTLAGKGDPTEEREHLAEILDALEAGEASLTDVKEFVTETFRQYLGAELDQLQAERDRLDEKLQAERDQLETLEAVKDLQQRCRQLHDDYAEVYQQFTAALEDGRRVVETKPPVGKRLTSNFIHRVDPRHKTGAKTATSLAASKILEEADDRKNVVDTIQKMLKTRIVKKRFNGLVNTSLATDREPAGTFDQTYVSVGVMTEAYDESGAAENRLDASHFPIEENLDIRTARSDGFKSWHIRNGGPWDIAITAFIQGITFLDNLNDVFQGQYSYANAYESKKGQADPLILRHALGLGDGYYVYRDGFLNLNDDRDRGLLVNTENRSEIAARIRNLIQRVSLAKADEHDADAISESPPDSADGEPVIPEPDDEVSDLERSEQDD